MITLPAMLCGRWRLAHPANRPVGLRRARLTAQKALASLSGGFGAVARCAARIEAKAALAS